MPFGAKIVNCALENYNQKNDDEYLYESFCPAYKKRKVC